MLRKAARGFGRLAMTVLRCPALRCPGSLLTVVRPGVVRPFAESIQGFGAVCPFVHNRTHQPDFLTRDSKQAGGLLNRRPGRSDDRGTPHLCPDSILSQRPRLHPGRATHYLVLVSRSRAAVKAGLNSSAF